VVIVHLPAEVRTAVADDLSGLLFAQDCKNCGAELARPRAENAGFWPAGRPVGESWAVFGTLWLPEDALPGREAMTCQGDPC
jgi:hypothetical protein